MAPRLPESLKIADGQALSSLTVVPRAASGMQTSKACNLRYVRAAFGRRRPVDRASLAAKVQTVFHREPST